MFSRTQMAGLLLCLSACMEAGGNSAATPVATGAIQTKAQFVATIANRNLTFGNNSIRYFPDGYLWGNINNQSFVGAWEWRGTSQCQTSDPPVAVGCQSWTVKGTVAFATSTQGRGETAKFNISN